jgi:hypothetical protein
MKMAGIDFDIQGVWRKDRREFAVIVARLGQAVCPLWLEFLQGVKEHKIYCSSNTHQIICHYKMPWAAHSFVAVSLRHCLCKGTGSYSGAYNVTNIHPLRCEAPDREFSTWISQPHNTTMY